MAYSTNDISKFLSYVPRHKPDAIGLALDPEGWADIEDLIVKSDIPLNLNILHKIVETSDKKRFSLSGDGRYIRANQGHSIDVNLGLEPAKPPKFLYHGTATRFLKSIEEKGLLPQNRQYLHLSSDPHTAAEVGQRHGKPIVLIIPALSMYHQGHKFFQAKNGVWLTENVPPEVISS
ncbi:RNA 2'-phosphotransferase [Halomonas denitrificans]|nr:RNA 2'-phosphotransferase [Halomonas denitrificans]